MLSKEEIENIEETFERNLEILSRRMIGTATEITIIEQPMILLFKDLIWRLKKQQKEIDYLETNNKNLIEKLEDLINNKFRAFFEGNTEFPDNATKMKIVKYIKATDLEEILKIVKGEKE